MNRRYATNALLIASLAGAFAAGTAALAADGSSSGSDTAKCYGVNKCKGTGDCGGKGHSCAGQNSCKRQGYIEMSKNTCLRLDGGRLTAEADGKSAEQSNEQKPAKVEKKS